MGLVMALGSGDARIIDQKMIIIIVALGVEGWWRLSKGYYTVWNWCCDDVTYD